jgi:divalent metal cation (Fe/Co/Zn/Cd) transporter
LSNTSSTKSGDLKLTLEREISEGITLADALSLVIGAIMTIVGIIVVFWTLPLIVLLLPLIPLLIGFILAIIGLRLLVNSLLRVIDRRRVKRQKPKPQPESSTRIKYRIKRSN